MQGKWAALRGGLLFAVHPVHTQAVTYIVQRLTSLAAFFYLLSLVLYVQARLLKQDSAKGPGGLAVTIIYVLVLASLMLGMKTKEIMFTAPLTIALYEGMFFEGRARRRLGYLLPILLTMAVIPLGLMGRDKPLHILLTEVIGSLRVQTETSRWEYFLTQFTVIVHYLRLLFAPVGLNLDYDWPVYRKQDVLVVQTGCGAIAAAKLGLLLGEAGLTEVGNGLREVWETVGIPPVLHMGSCVDNTRILTVLTQMVEEGGLGDDIDQIPAVGLAPWMSEKAHAIAVYCVASGAYVIFGGASPVSGMPDRVNDSDLILKYISEGWEKQYGGKLEFIPDPQKMIEATLAPIDKKRAALGLPEWDANKFGRSGDKAMLELEKLLFEQRREAISVLVPTRCARRYFPRRSQPDRQPG